MTEIAYAYDHQGIFVSAIKCQPCKIELGKFLLPARATWIAPPEQVDGKMRVFNGVKWEYRDIPKQAVVVEAPVQKSLEIRENPELLKLTVDNMRADLEIRVMKAAGASIENFRSKLSEFDSDIEQLNRLTNGIVSNVSDHQGMIDSVVMMNGVLNQRIDNLAIDIESLNARLLELGERLQNMALPPAEKETAASDELVAAVEKKSMFKFWS